jgi:hypothetical protein
MIMKSILTFAIALSLTGCGWFDRKMAAVTGDATVSCIGGVEYLQFTSGATVAYTPDGKIKTCAK